VLGKDFGVDALLGNWDVLGLDWDNVLITQNYTPEYFRVDVGGSLNKRAQGEDKEFGPVVSELDTLLDSDINPNTAKFFSGIDIQKILKDTVARYDNVKHIIENDNQISQDIKNTLEQRAAYMKSKIILPKKSSLNYKGKLYNVIEGYHDQDIVDFYSRLNTDMILTEDEIKELGDHDSDFTEKHAEKYFKDHYNSNQLVKSAIKAGMTYLELYSIRDYTGGEYGYYNSIAKGYTTSVNGNVNFDQSSFSSDKEEFEEKEIKNIIGFEDYFDTILSAIKSVNHSIEQTGTANSANESKISAAKNVNELLGSMFNGNSDPKQTKQAQLLMAMYDKLLKSIANSKKTGVITKPASIKNLETIEVVKLKKTKSSNKSELKINGFANQDPTYVTKLKLLCNSIGKLEEIKHPFFHMQGQLNRGIDISDSNRDLFRQQHNTPNKTVMHQWGSSTSWNNTGFSGRNTKLIIYGHGAHINSISQHSGSESEILLRPFTLFKTGMMKDYNDNNGVAEVSLMKII